ncbi:hypothetical protein JYG32_28050 [Burkholderia pyrrocinia]|nr:hypothetical protein JYG32_28050 [Burkholderia pyrrocinia]
MHKITPALRNARLSCRTVGRPGRRRVYAHKLTRLPVRPSTTIKRKGSAIRYRQQPAARADDARRDSVIIARFVDASADINHAVRSRRRSPPVRLCA